MELTITHDLSCVLGRTFFDPKTRAVIKNYRFWRTIKTIRTIRTMASKTTPRAKGILATIRPVINGILIVIENNVTFYSVVTDESIKTKRFCLGKDSPGLLTYTHLYSQFRSFIRASTPS